MKKQQIVVLLDPKTRAIHLPWLLEAFTARRVDYGNRRVLEVSFSARDCDFVPDGGADINTGKTWPIIFDTKVLEIRVGGEVRKNRSMCPECCHLSLKVTRTDETTRPATFHARCDRIGCGGEKTFT